VREAGTDEGGGGFELLGFLGRELLYLGKLFGSVCGFAGGGGAGGEEVAAGAGVGLHESSTLELEE